MCATRTDIIVTVCMTMNDYPVAPLRYPRDYPQVNRLKRSSWNPPIFFNGANKESTQKKETN
jgi:hypothetical protein